MSHSTPPPTLTGPRKHPRDEKTFKAGTLSYTIGGLWLLFFWLLWNDMCLALMENVAPQLAPLLLKEHGASNKDIAFFLATLPGIFTIWINPVVSTWSDRHRSPAGRRRPFLLFATPFCAIALAAIPFMPDLFRWFLGIRFLSTFLASHSSCGIVALIGICFVSYQVFNSVILAIFTYYFWDVVPEEVLGRFTALTKIVTTLAVFIWNYFLFGMAEKYMKEIFVGVAVFFFAAYVLSILQVKEGEYPPPAAKAPSMRNMIRSYFSDCFRPYFLWYIVANAVFQVGNVANGFQIFLFKDQLHLSLDIIGKMRALPTLLVVLVAYPMGSLVDRLRPGRVFIASIVLYGLADIGAFYFLNGKWSLCFFMGLIALIGSALGISASVYNVEFFPREKLGQFCSANAMTYNLSSLIAAFFAGIFFDWVKDYRFAFVWASAFYFLSVPLYIKCYLNWLRVQKASAVPATSDAQAELVAPALEGAVTPSH